jgi:hypothetical protein
VGGAAGVLMGGEDHTRPEDDGATLFLTAGLLFARLAPESHRGTFI